MAQLPPPCVKLLHLLQAEWRTRGVVRDPTRPAPKPTATNPTPFVESDLRYEGNTQFHAVPTRGGLSAVPVLEYAHHTWPMSDGTSRPSQHLYGDSSHVQQKDTIGGMIHKGLWGIAKFFLPPERGARPTMTPMQKLSEPAQLADGTEFSSGRPTAPDNRSFFEKLFGTSDSTNDPSSNGLTHSNGFVKCLSGNQLQLAVAHSFMTTEVLEGKVVAVDEDGQDLPYEPAAEGNTQGPIPEWYEAELRSTWLSNAESLEESVHVWRINAVGTELRRRTFIATKQERGRDGKPQFKGNAMNLHVEELLNVKDRGYDFVPEAKPSSSS